VTSDRAVRRFPIRRWWFRPLLLAGSTALALLAGELAARALGLAPAVKPIALLGENTVYRLSEDPVLGFELKAGYRDEHPNLFYSYPSTNSHGQRDVERTVEKPPGVRRILVLGDSVVEGEGIRDIDATMSRQLEKLFPDGKTEVLNFGVSGYCTLAEVELLAVKGVRFRPDGVVLVFVENDFDNFNRQLIAFKEGFSRPAIVNLLFLHSHLFRAACLRFDLFRFRAEDDPVERNQKAIGLNNVVVGLRRLAALSRDHGFEVLVAIWPRFLNDRIEDGPFMPGSTTDLVVERLSRMVGLRAERLSAHFERHRASLGPKVNPRLHYTVNGDSMHPSAEGCRVAAEALREAILDWQKGVPSGGRVETAADPAAIEAAAQLGGQKADPSSMFNNQGSALQARGKIPEAIASFQKAVELNPRNVSARHNLGETLKSAGRIEEAAAEFQKALEIDPEYSPAHYSLGLVLLEKKQRADASAHFERALKASPEYCDLHYRLGRQAAEEGQTAQAALFYSQVIQVRPDHADAQYALGSILFAAGDLDGALRRFQASLAARADLLPAVRGAAWILATHPRAEVRQPEQAVELAERAIRLSGRRDPDTLDVLAAAYAAGGQFDLAIATVKEAMDQATGQLTEGLTARLALYRQGKPMVSATRPLPGKGPAKP
jgi:tetratricopeptide (TPR) repeat protein/lysophospholipase L1-like esterase